LSDPKTLTIRITVIRGHQRPSSAGPLVASRNSDGRRRRAGRKPGRRCQSRMWKSRPTTQREDQKRLTVPAHFILESNT
jgi:hypothetical protein